MEYRFGDITIACTHVEREVDPEHGITKGDVIAYYADVAPLMVPELRDRPLTIERYTKTFAAGGFYQKHAQKHYPKWIRRFDVAHKKPVTYPIADDEAAVVYFANQGGFVFHVWTSRAAAPERPDLLVFDLDPPAGEVALVRRVATIIREVFEAIGLAPFVKTTGGKGLHVVAALDGAADFGEVHALTGAISQRLCTAHPDLVTTEFHKVDRKGRLFLDTLRNAPGATVVAPYSLRGRAGAPASVPIAWDELDAIAPDGVRMRDVRALLDRRGDPWRELRARPGSVAAASRALAALR